MDLELQSHLCKATFSCCRDCCHELSQIKNCLSGKDRKVIHKGNVEEIFTFLTRVLGKLLSGILYQCSCVVYEL